jgi:nucleoid-associated protein YgaU
MPDSRLRRAAQALRDPWSVLAACVGAGAAWALALPIGGIASVGLGMLGVAAAAGAVASGNKTSDAGQERVLRTGTRQYRLVETLESYLKDLTRLSVGELPPALTSSAADGVEAARTARTVSIAVAGSIDALDGALGRAGQVVKQMSEADRVAGSVGRMVARREELLVKLASAVDGVGELYTKLLELSTTTDLSVDLALDQKTDPVSEVNSSLDAIRGAFAELETAAQKTTDRLNSPDSL